MLDSGNTRLTIGLGLATEWIEIFDTFLTMTKEYRLGLATEWIEMLVRALL